MKRKELWEMEEVLFQIDLNDGFCTDGLLADPTIKELVEENVEKEVRDVLSRGEGYVVISDWHTEDSVEIKRYGVHCHNDDERKTIKRLAVYEEYATAKFRKNSTCAIFAPGMMEFLLQLTNLKRVKLVGCLTEICVANFAVALRWFFDEHNMDIDIIVDEKCVETFEAPGHQREENNNYGFEVMGHNAITLVREKKEGK